MPLYPAKKTVITMTLVLIAGIILLQVVTLVGWGQILNRICKFDLSLPGLGLLGLLALGSFSLLVHTFIPLSQGYASAVYLVEIISAAKLLRAKSWLWVLALLPALSFATYLGDPQYDTGLYHLTTILWNQSQPLTFGLANLFVNLSFNSIWFMLAPALSVPGKENLGIFCINSTLAALVVWFGILGSTQKLQTKLLRYFVLIFTTAYLVQLVFDPIVLLTTNYLSFPLSGPSNDFPANSIGFIALYFLLESFVHKSNLVSLRKAVAFSLLASLIKLSMVPLLLISLGLLLWKGNQMFALTPCPGMHMTLSKAGCSRSRPGLAIPSSQPMQYSAITTGYMHTGGHISAEFPP